MGRFTRETKPEKPRADPSKFPKIHPFVGGRYSTNKWELRHHDGPTEHFHWLWQANLRRRKIIRWMERVARETNQEG